MKADDIVKQMKAVLPTLTDQFSTDFSVTSLTRSGSTVTSVTSSAHGLSTGSFVTIKGALTPVSISSLTFLDGIATAVTSSRHDLTEGFENGNASDDPQVTVSGATESEYNGSHDLLSVPNRTGFTYSVTGTPSTPATGTPKLLEQFASGYNGRHQITVLDTTTFTYEITETPESPAQGTIVAATDVRIARSVSIERTQAAYTAQELDTLWAFVVLGDTLVSKNRHVENDATDTQAAGDAFRQRMIKPFGVFIFVPTTAELAAGAARDLMEDLESPLFKSLLRVKFDENLSSDPEYGVVLNGHQFFSYDGATYIHQFIFESVSDIIYEDTVDPDFNVAFRDIPFEIVDELGTTELSVTVDLDDVPN